MRGLSICNEDFKKLPQKQQLMVLYENTEEIKRMVTHYKLNQKIQYVWIGLLTIGLGAGKYLNVI